MRHGCNEMARHPKSGDTRCNDMVRHPKSDGCLVVISQTISWVSQVRLATVSLISIFIE